MTTAPAMLNLDDRYRRLVADLRLIVWEFDPATKRFVYVSPQAETILGYRVDEWQQPQFWYSHVHPDDREQVARFSRERAARGEDYEVEYRMLRSDGQAVWFRDLTSVVKRDGSPLALHGVLIDITDRVRVEEALRQSERRFRSMSENSVVGIWQATIDGHTLYINPSMCRMLGIQSPDELRGRTFHDFFTAESQQIMAAEHAGRQAGRASTYEIELISRSGRRHNVLVAGSPVFDPAGAVQSMIATFIDITERKQAEQALQRSNELQQLLLSELDHRVRNNLASLAGLVEISASDGRSARELAASIRSRVQAMSVVHALLSREHWRAVDLRQLVQTLAPEAAPAAVRLTGPAVDILPRQATALGMVLQELFANSQKYGALATGDGHLEIDWTVQAARDQGPLLRLQWRERGGPAITRPVREGVGTGLIQGLMRTELCGEAVLRFPAEGAQHELTGRLDQPEPVEAPPHLPSSPGA